MKKYSKYLSIFLIAIIISTGISQVAEADQVSKSKGTTRLEGSTRIKTAIRVSEEIYTKSNVVVLAGTKGEADALTGTILAAAKDAPLLFTETGRIQFFQN